MVYNGEKKLERSGGGGEGKDSKDNIAAKENSQIGRTSELSSKPLKFRNGICLLPP